MNKDFYTNMEFLQEFDYIDQIPVNTFAASVHHMPIHMHDGIELLFVLEGTVSVKISFNNYELKAGDFLLINTFEVHNISKISGSNKILFVQMDAEIFSGKLFAFDPYFYRFFYIEKVKAVKSLMLKILSLYDSNASADVMMSCIDKIVKICDSYFQMHNYDVKNKKITDFNGNLSIKDRIKSTVKYLYFEFDRKIRLTDLAEMEHIDKSYASRLIKSGTGVTFQEYLNIVRVDRAEVLLLGTNEPIGDICDHLGFSSYNYFINQFKQFFRMSPSEYRKKFRQDLYPAKHMEYDPIRLSDKDISRYRNLTLENAGNPGGNPSMAGDGPFGKMTGQYQFFINRFVKIP